MERSPQSDVSGKGIWRLLDRLPAPIRKFFINRETILYVVFGVLTTVVSYVVGLLCYYTLPLEAALLNLVSNGISWVAAVAFAFVTNKIFVFESKAGQRACCSMRFPLSYPPDCCLWGWNCWECGFWWTAPVSPMPFPKS